MNYIYNGATDVAFIDKKEVVLVNNTVYGEFPQADLTVKKMIKTGRLVPVKNKETKKGKGK